MRLQTGVSPPAFVWIFLALQIGAGLALIAAPVLSHRRWQKHRDSIVIPEPQLQFALWLALLLSAIVCLTVGKPLVALVLVACAQLLPRYAVRRHATNKSAPVLATN